jgi:hypothetical protein
LAARRFQAARELTRLSQYGRFAGEQQNGCETG